jgi:hypothetical protein
VYDLSWIRPSYYCYCYMCTVLTRMYIGDLDIYPIIISGVPIHFWFILYILYHPFRFILESDFTPCMTRYSNSYRKYFSILYREGSTVQTSMTVEISHFVFYIYRRNKKNNRLDERVTCERPVKCSHGCSDDTPLQGWKK